MCVCVCVCVCVFLIVCDVGTSTTRRLRAELGCCAKKEEEIPVNYHDYKKRIKKLLKCINSKFPLRFQKQDLVATNILLTRTLPKLEVFPVIEVS
jgi:hypothetical protein